MRANWLVIDGYSLLHRDPETARLLDGRGALARRRLILDLERAHKHLADRITIVFDGRGQGDEVAVHSDVIEVTFSPSHLTADSVIERLVCASPTPETILVITSDRSERETVSAAGADTMSCGDFLEWLRRDTPKPSKKPGDGPSGPKRGPTLGDFFPA